MRRNFILSERTDDLLKQLAGELQLDMTETVSTALAHLGKSTWPPAKVGYFKLDRLGEIDAPTCHECDQPLTGNGWMIVFSDGTLRGPVCDSCARSEE